MFSPLPTGTLSSIFDSICRCAAIPPFVSRISLSLSTSSPPSSTSLDIQLLCYNYSEVRGTFEYNRVFMRNSVQCDSICEAKKLNSRVGENRQRSVIKRFLTAHSIISHDRAVRVFLIECPNYFFATISSSETRNLDTR